jgi:hypothetical protein
VSAPARGVRGTLLAVLLALPLLAAGPAGAAGSTGGWRAEFEAICARTQDAMALTTQELKDLVARSDALRPELDKLDPPQRKVFTTRLNACRNLYQFVLDSREQG